MDRDEISNLNREPSIDTFYQVSIHLAKWFQRGRLKYEKLTDDGCQVMANLTWPKDRNTNCRERKILEKGEINLLTWKELRNIHNKLFQLRKKQKQEPK
jgi:hypothetical protein